MVKITEVHNVFDIIVIGGGPAGCVVAGRLARADPELQVLLIEAGANNHESEWVYRPGIFVKNMQNDGVNEKATFYVDSEPSPHLRGRKAIVPCANILGGGSSINFQMYTRASASDWDDFKTEGWTHKDLFPLMMRLEKYQKPSNNCTHGSDGPIAISNGGQIDPIAQDFLRASGAIGIPFSDDLQDLEESHAAEIWAKYINLDTGRRSDAAHAYIHPVMKLQKNLHIRTHSKGVRVVFEGDQAIGATFLPAQDPGSQRRVETFVRARKCVVISSGTLGTPQILERSGIGSAENLTKLGIKVVSDLPGVGEQYQDHYTTLSLFRASNETATVDDFMRGVPAIRESVFSQYDSHPKKASLASNHIDAGMKIRPTEAELETMGPEFNALFDKYFREKPDKPVMFSSIVSGAYADHTLLPPGKYFTLFNYLEYPASRGHIHISSKDPYLPPKFDSGFMNDKADFAPIRWGYKKSREIARRMAAFRGELTSHHPHFHPASPAATKDIDIETAKQILPGSYTTGIHMGTWHKPSPSVRSAVTADIEYTQEDDEAIDNWISDHVETTWHSLGTCAMKPRGEGGVVDGELNVFGTRNLKIADLSICPDNLGTNTYSSALLVGEKAAEILSQELGLKIIVPHVPEEHRI